MAVTTVAAHSLTLSAPAAWRPAAQDIIAALDSAQFSRRHLSFLIVLQAALVLDYAKPINISFVIPGMAEMWNLTALGASYLAVASLTGHVLGALVWGYVGDRIGRRATLIWTVLIFSIASLCGLAVEYWHSLLACLIMGFGAGGEAPIVFALAAEYVPVKNRSRTLLILGISGWLGGYVVAAGLSAILKSFYAEDFAWRLIWLANIIPGLVVLFYINRVLPESARFLLQKGRVAEAQRAAEVLIGPIQMTPALAESGSHAAPPNAGPAPRFYDRTIASALFAFASGLAHYGFITWLPTLFAMLGFSGAGSATYLTLAAFIALPSLGVTVLVLARLGARRTLVAYAQGCAASLALLGVGLMAGWKAPGFLIPVISAVVLFNTGIGAALSLYIAEIFPTSMRTRRSGLVSGARGLGGVTGPYLGGLWLASGGAIQGLQLPLAVALFAGAIALILAGVETHGRTLEQINEPHAAPAAGLDRASSASD